jgi:hypothetical protein
MIGFIRKLNYKCNFVVIIYNDSNPPFITAQIPYFKYWGHYTGITSGRGSSMPLEIAIMLDPLPEVMPVAV